MKQSINFSSAIICLLSLSFLFGLNPAFAETRYVSDSLLISIRSAPNGSAPVLSTIRTGTKMTVLEQGKEYIKIETTDNKVGWVPKYYTETNLPKAEVIANLEKTVERLEKEVTAYKNKTSEIESSYTSTESALSSQVQELTMLKEQNMASISELSTQLEGITQKYEDLLIQSENPLKTVEERDSLKKEVNLIKGKVTALESENDSLKNYKMIYWFATGGGIFLLGWIIGKLSQRSTKRSLSL